MRPYEWGALILMAWGLTAGYSKVRDALPNSHWYEAGKMEVSDVVSGECPTLLYNRTISNSFHGEFFISLRRQGPTGGWIPTPPNWTGESDYRPDAELPVPLTFAWWVYDPNVTCDWQPGIYRIENTIAMDAGGDTRYVRFNSEPFTVHPKEQ